MKTRIDEVMEAEERRATKVRDLIERLRDPDVADFVSKLLGERPGSAAVVPGRTDATNLNGHHPLANMSVTPAIRLIAHALPKSFTVRDVVQHLRNSHFDFGERKPESAVGDAMYFLARGKKPMFRIAVEGKGGQPNEYELVE
jgi:hypothetical protein